MSKHRIWSHLRPLEIVGPLIAFAAAFAVTLLSGRTLAYPSPLTYVCVGALLAMVGGLLVQVGRLTFRLAEHREATRNVWSNYGELLASVAAEKAQARQATAEASPSLNGQVA